MKNILQILNKSFIKESPSVELYTSEDFLNKLCEIIKLGNLELTKTYLNIISQLTNINIEDFSFPESIYQIILDTVRGNAFETRKTALYIIGQLSSTIEEESRIVEFAELFMNSLMNDFIATKILSCSYIADICKRFPDVRASLVENGIIETILEIMKDITPACECFVDYAFDILLNIAENGSIDELQKLYETNTIGLLLVDYNLLDNENPLGKGTKDPQKHTLYLIILLLSRDNPEVTQAIFECDIISKASALFNDSFALFNDSICSFMFNLLTMGKKEIVDEMIQLDVLQKIFSNISCHQSDYIILCLNAIASILDISEDYKEILLSIDVLKEIEEVLEENPSDEVSQMAEALLEKME